MGCDMSVIDVHAHILCGVDDGSKNMGTTRRMLKRAYEQGVRAIIATPHYTKQRWRPSPAQIRRLICDVQEEADRITPGLTIYSGMEIYYHSGMEKGLLSGKLLTLADSRYVLIEFHPSVAYSQIEAAVRELSLSGYIPVIAHVERYQCLRQGSHLSNIREMGGRIQMNYCSLVHTNGMFDVRGVRERSWCRKVLAGGMVDLLGSDMHGMNHRPPEYEAAARWISGKLGEDILQQLTEENPRRILEKNGLM